MATGTREAVEKLEPRESGEQFKTLEDQVRQRAREIWLERGDQPGSDVTDWLQAEEEILGEIER